MGIHECLRWMDGWIDGWLNGKKSKMKEILQWFNELTGRRALVLNHFVKEKKKIPGYKEK